MSEYNDPPGTPPPYEPQAHAPSNATSAEARQWAMFAHLSALLGAVLTGGWGCFIGPLIIWLVKKDAMPFVDDQGKEALNFNITAGAIYLALILLTLMTFGIGVIIAVPIGVVVFVVWLVLTIIAGVKANEGVAYRYPLTLRLIK
ncbi:DUF4870 domain-containing protein [Lysobacter korlensis]|uniref:DUF4870 domain-containing protein n=1 Tax=Lysobacter korlensis TaxID=553636 RepID=A0ABV6RQY7_9GAMM